MKTSECLVFLRSRSTHLASSLHSKKDSIMKLILMSTPYFFVEEHQILTALFEEGLEILHLRKPETEPVYSERLLTLIPQEFRKRIVVHDHFYLKNEYGLKGIHLNHRNPELPPKYKGPIFDSISKENYDARFTIQELKALQKSKVIDRKVMALGGVNLENIAVTKSLGFGGAVLLGDIWNRFSIHTTQDFKDIITHFRRLKRAAE